MTAMRRKMLEQGPEEIEMLLPWHVAGTLNARDACRVEAALARDSRLARLGAEMRDEQAAILEFNDGQRGPSPHVMRRLFAAIDAESGGPHRDGSFGTVAPAVTKLREEKIVRLAIVAQ